MKVLHCMLLNLIILSAGTPYKWELVMVRMTLLQNEETIDVYKWFHWHLIQFVIHAHRMADLRSQHFIPYIQHREMIIAMPGSISVCSTLCLYRLEFEQGKSQPQCSLSCRQNHGYNYYSLYDIIDQSSNNDILM